MRQTILAATTSAASNALFFDAQTLEFINVSADNLATTEEVDFLVDGKAVTNQGGTAIKLTASIPMQRLEGGVYYRIDKDATAGACAIHVWPGPSIAR